LSNASYPETINILNQTDVDVEPFQLAGARQMYTYNYSTGAVAPTPDLAPQFSVAVSSEIPRYIQLWNERFRPISTTNYKVRHASDMRCAVAQNPVH
jgi:hypothetical protein